LLLLPDARAGFTGLKKGSKKGKNQQFLAFFSAFFSRPFARVLRVCCVLTAKEKGRKKWEKPVFFTCFFGA